MKSFIYLLACALVGEFACRQPGPAGVVESVVAQGHAVSMARGGDGGLHLAFCRGDSMLYAFSGDGGKSFSGPELVAVYPGLASSHARGPQVAVSAKTVSVIGCNKTGNIVSFKRTGSGSWLKAAQINDRDSAASEGLMSLAGDSSLLFAVWLDARDKYTKIYGASSADGGDHWSKNVLIYASPDSMVCSCCRPSVAIRGNQVFVMFRNLLGGNRDLYLTRSADGGNHFDAAEKLGSGSWALNGCPMDGGALVVRDDGQPETVWRRQDKIYRCVPGKPEQEIATGRACGMATADNQDIYVWTDHDQVLCGFPGDRPQVLGQGSLPVIRAYNGAQFVCLWEHEQQIHAAVVSR